MPVRLTQTGDQDGGRRDKMTNVLPGKRVLFLFQQQSGRFRALQVSVLSFLSADADHAAQEVKGF
jgi:hypothetical protein